MTARVERHDHPARRVGAVLVAIVFLLGLTGCGADDPVYDLRDGATTTGEADYAFYIPAGSGDRLDRGLSVEIMPNWLDATVGETIEIVNDDDRGHLVGPFYVGAGETLRQRFAVAGQFEGICTVHPSGQIVVNVTA